MTQKATEPVFLTSVGARSTLGLSALQTAMLLRAHRGNPRSLRFKDKRGRFIGACVSPGLPDDLHGVDRLLALGAPALRAAVPKDTISAKWPLLLAVPEKGRPDDDPCLDGPILQALSEASNVPIHEAGSRTFRAGHAGVIVAICEALREIEQGAPAVIVGGVDSYMHPDVLAFIDEECRLHAVDAENGFVPGEGAAFLVLSPKPKDPIVMLRRALCTDEQTVDTDAPNIGEAMTTLLRDLSAWAPDGKLTWSLTDVNGERHRIREWRLAAGRGAFADDATHDRPADHTGDLGAATGAVLCAIAYELFRTGAAPSPSACVALSSDGTQRGALLMSHAQEGGR